MFRGMIERDRDIEERRRDEIAEKLSVYKREVKSTNHQSIDSVNFGSKIRKNSPEFQLWERGKVGRKARGERLKIGLTGIPVDFVLRTPFCDKHKALGISQKSHIYGYMGLEAS